MLLDSCLKKQVQFSLNDYGICFFGQNFLHFYIHISCEFLSEAMKDTRV